jgi:hypothetical protein
MRKPGQEAALQEQYATVSLSRWEYQPFARVEEGARSIPSKRRFVLLAALVVFSFCLIVNDSWNATPDSALYLALGESLARGDGYVFNDEPHTFVPPGFPLILAAAAKICGDKFFCYRASMAIMGLLSAAAASLLIMRLCGPGCAFLVGGVFAVSYTLLRNSTLILADVPFTLFTLIALNGLVSAARSEHGMVWTLTAGALFGLLPLIRINGLGAAPAAAFFLLCAWKDETWPKKLLHVLMFALLAYAPWVGWQFWKASFPVSASEGTYFSMVAHKGLEDHLRVIIGDFWGYFPETTFALTGLNIKTGLLEIIIPVLILWGTFISFRRGERLLVPFTAIQFCGLLLSVPGDRYLLPLLPGLYLFLGVGLLDLADRISGTVKSFPKPERLLIGAFLVLGALNIGHNMVPIVQARTALESQGAESDRGLPYFVAARWLKEHAPDARVLTTQPRIIHYLSGCRTVALVRSGVPEREALVSEQSQLKTLISESKPNFIFVDHKDADLYAQVFQAVRDLGFTLKEVPAAGPAPRYALFEIIPEPNPDECSRR